MIPEVAQSPYQKNTRQARCVRRQTVNYLKKLDLHCKILDIGARSPLSDAIEKELGLKVVNTTGDLDYSFSVPVRGSNFILYSHTIEHQFNPLFTLQELRKRLYGSMLIILPSRPKFLWSKGHYHEIDHYRIKLLLKRAGYRIVSYKRVKFWRDWWQYLSFRGIMRLLFEYNAYYLVKPFTRNIAVFEFPKSK